MVEIHPRLRKDELRFVLLGSFGEDLKKPFEKDWQKKSNYRYDDPRLSEHMKRGGNYGVAGGYGDLHIIDCDDLNRWLEMGVMSLIPPTFAIESRPGHRQFYLKCEEHFNSVGLFDPERTEINKQAKHDYVHIGDIKAGAKDGICGGQAVGPSCRHQSDSTYQVVQDLPIAEVSREHLQSIISRFKTSRSVNANYKRLEGDLANSKRRKYTEKDPLDSLQVEDIMPPEGNVSRSGDELRGDHPIHGSTNGGNYVINTAENKWHCFRCESGGGPALAIAVKHDIISCSNAQAGELRGDLFRQVLEIAKAQYLPHAYSEPTIRKVSLDDQSGTVGVGEDGTIKRVVALSKDDPSQKELHWVSDCALYIDTETRAGDVAEFKFRGRGAKDHREVSFILQAADLEPRKFKTHLINYFGAKNQTGKLDFETVQRMTRNTRIIRRIETPAWVGNVPMVPGIGDDLAKNIEFKLSPMTPAKVYAGDFQAAKDLLSSVLKVHPNAPILVATILGAPAVARWRPDDRFALALWGVTGAIKTTMAQICMAVYGLDYTLDRFLLKHGKAGSTVNAAMHIMARAGILCQILDNVKAVDPKDFERYVSIIQATIEGSDKQRGRKDGGTVEALTFLCTPIITGETRPEEAATDARVLNLDWPKLTNTELLTEVQNKLELMPVVGYYWLRFLAETKLDINYGFAETRNKYEQKFAKGGYVNPGRLATLYTTLQATWRLLCESPLGDVFKEAEERFLVSLDTAIQVQGAIVNADTEVSKFLTGVNELLDSQPGLFQSSNGKTILGRVIGKHTNEGLFLLPNETLAELDKLKVFTQKPTVDSIGKALADAGKLAQDKDGKHRQVVRRVSGLRTRGWLLSPIAFDGDTTPVVTEKREQEPTVTTNTTDTTEKAKCNFKENFEDQRISSNSEIESNNSGGAGGDNGDSNVIDSDFSVTTPSPPNPEVGTPATVADLQTTGEQKKKRQNRRRTCVICGEVSKFDLYIGYKHGYICHRCHREHRTLDSPQKEKGMEKASTIQAALQQANEQDKQREKKFKTPVAEKKARWTEDQPKLAPAPKRLSRAEIEEQRREVQEFVSHYLSATDDGIINLSALRDHANEMGFPYSMVLSEFRKLNWTIDEKEQVARRAEA